MTLEQNKAIVRRFYEAINRRNLTALDELATPDFVDHDPSNPRGDLEGARQFFQAFSAAFPDARFDVEDLLAEGDKVVARFVVSGTQRGEFMGLPPTGRSFRASGIDIIRMARGKAVEHWGEFDQLGMLQQLGAMPAPEQAGR